MVATIPNKRLRRGLSIAIVLLMAALSFGLEFHHHKDGDSHNDCPLCLASHSPFLTTPSVHDPGLVLPPAGRNTSRYCSIAPRQPDFSLPIIRSPTA